MHDPASGSHPLDIAGADAAGVAEGVLMIDLAADHVGNGLDSPVGMHGKAFDVILRIVRPKMIEKQKRVEVIQARGRDAALKPDTGTLHNCLRLDDVYNFSGLIVHNLYLWSNGSLIGC